MEFMAELIADGLLRQLKHSNTGQRGLQEEKT
jgi:hypothetical protein